jgi:hypothetical protein
MVDFLALYRRALCRECCSREISERPRAGDKPRTMRPLGWDDHRCIELLVSPGNRPACAEAGVVLAARIAGGAIVYGTPFVKAIRMTFGQGNAHSSRPSVAAGTN